MFAYVVLTSAFLLAACAAWFSVSGIAQLFAGAGLAAGFMAFALELGKLVGVSFLYRYRKQVPKLLRTYMWIGTIVLMMITSVGIYGYLSSAYAVSAVGIQEKQNQITLYDSQVTTIDDNITRLSKRSDELQGVRSQQEDRLDEMLRVGRNTTRQQQIIQDQDKQIGEIESEISQLSRVRDSLSVLKTSTTNSIGTTGKIGTFYYVAESLGVPLDVIVKWFIVVLVIVFDPMSISLFIAYNIIVDKKQKAVTIVSDSEAESEVAPAEQITSNNLESANNPEILTTELPTLYYMQPGYDWTTDTRWHDDPDARGFKGTLGY